MKRSDISRTASRLVWIAPLSLSVPALLMSVLGHVEWYVGVAQVLLPFALMLILLALVRRVGLTVLLLTPLMVLAAFQIVLLFLYGDGAVIGVDMFLNVATTNSSEALELLGNLLPAITVVVVIYLPVIIMAAISCRRHSVAAAGSRHSAFFIGTVSGLLGFAALGCCYLHPRTHYRLDEDFYPVNALANLYTAFVRSYRAAHYVETSAAYRYDAQSVRPDSLREVYIAVVGETSRADNWQIFGYDRFTTPHLANCKSAGLTAFGKCLSQSNTTHKSVPLLLSPLTASGFDRGLDRVKSVITAFKEAGFATAYLSMQGRNGSYIDHFADEADSVLFVREPRPGVVNAGMTDCDLLPFVDSLMASGARKQLIVLHTYGSHFNYFDRYPRSEAFFLPDVFSEAVPANRQRMINAYDNSIRHTDQLLGALLQRLDSLGAYGGLIYAADHGEDIYDDFRRRFLHASPTTTFHQLHVPMLLYMNQALCHDHPEMLQAAKAHCSLSVCSSTDFTPTLLHIAGIRTPRVAKERMLTSPAYCEPDELLFLNDRNRPEPLEASGFTDLDFAMLLK